MSKPIVMNKSTEVMAIIAGWSLAFFLGIVGVITFYSTNPSLFRLGISVVLMLGFLTMMKVGSAILFDARNNMGIRFISLLLVAGLVLVDVFSGAQTLQSGVMDQVGTTTTANTKYSEQKVYIQTLETQLSKCNPDYVTKCVNPLREDIKAARADLNTMTPTTDGQASFWHAMTNWVNGVSKHPIEMESVVLYTFIFIMLLASLITVYVFGIQGSAVVAYVQSNLDNDPDYTGTDGDQYRNDGNYRHSGAGFTAPTTASRNTRNQQPTNARGYHHPAPSSPQNGPINQLNQGGAAQQKANQRWGTSPTSGQIVGNAALKIEPETVLNTHVKHVDTPQHTQNTPKSEQKTNQGYGFALQVIWQGIDQGEITRLSVTDSGQCQTTLKAQTPVIGDNNPERRELLALVFDALLKEKVIMKNVDYTGAGCGKAQYRINPNRSIRFQS